MKHLRGWHLLDRTRDCEQLIFVGYPHTSRRDFFLTLAISLWTRRRLLTLVADCEFTGWKGWMLQRLNCWPVNPEVPGGTVDRVIEQLARERRTCLALCPEGRIEMSQAWLSGFYVTSLATDLPVSYVAFDYRERTVTLNAPVRMTGDPGHDLDVAREALSASHGYRPQDAGHIAFRPDWSLDRARLQEQRARWECGVRSLRTADAGAPGVLTAPPPPCR